MRRIGLLLAVLAFAACGGEKEPQQGTAVRRDTLTRCASAWLAR